MNTININGKSIQVSGNNISVINDKVYVNGKLVTEGLSGNVNISFEGELANLKADGSVEVNGEVLGNVDAGGSVKCENVQGYVDAGGSVNCKNVGGNIDAGGSIKMNR